MPYSLCQVLAIGRLHPFYNASIEYPPDIETVRTLALQVHNDDDTGDEKLSSFGTLWKKKLAKTIDRLVNDLNPQNTFRIQAYTSITGGGSGSQPLPFITDARENRKQRAEFGEFLRATGVLGEQDWVLTVHSAGELYRSLDLLAEIMECAGASVLCAGMVMDMEGVVDALQTYHVNALTGESSHLVRIVHHISTLTEKQKALIKLDKIIYTSEGFSPSQRALVRSVLGDVAIFSILGSAEAGPWAIHNPNLTGANHDTTIESFVFDTRSMKIEIFPMTLAVDDSNLSKPLPDGEVGLIVQTSLARLRHPVIRYNTGDLGSIHPLPVAARKQILGHENWQYLCVICLHGRDQRDSFKWDAMVFEFAKIAVFLEREEFGILHWQVVLDETNHTKATTLELRIMCLPRNQSLLSQAEILDRTQKFFRLCPSNTDRFKIEFLEDFDAFERSNTGRKIIKFIDRTRQKKA